MTKEQVLEEYCKIQSLVYRSIANYSSPSDGFCRKCPFANDLEGYRHSGVTIKYIRDAVIEKLQKDPSVSLVRLNSQLEVYKNDISWLPTEEIEDEDLLLEGEG